MIDDFKQKLCDAFEPGKDFWVTANELKIPYHLVETARHLWMEWEAEANQEDLTPPPEVVK